MSDSQLAQEAALRRTFAIISHPDAGKTTITEKMLLFGNAIQLAGSVKSKRAERHATSDWMKMEQERGISVTTSVMQFPYNGRIVNLLDTPGDANFIFDSPGLEWSEFKKVVIFNTQMTIIGAIKLAITTCTRV